MNDKLKSGMIITGLILSGAPLANASSEALKQRKAAALAKLRHKIKNFRIEYRDTFWGRRETLIQRDIPLTDEQVDEFLNIHNNI